MTPLILGLGLPEMVIILVVVLLLFGGTKLAGLGKSTGRALREFKEETKDLRSKDDTSAAQLESEHVDPEHVDAEIVEPTKEQIRTTTDAKPAEPRRDV